MPTTSRAYLHLAPSLPLLLMLPDAAMAATPGNLLSPWGMFMMADWVVKSVMIGLFIASLVTWTIWVVKTLELRRARLQSLPALYRLNRAASLLEAKELTAECKGPVCALLAAVEIERSQSRQLPAAGIKERLAGRFTRIETTEARKSRRATGLLATIGSTAPFIGLFGTVWGIMNSFVGIAAAQTTNLAVVAPGIAEALLATALGLVAAIPAVMMYNHFARKISDYRGLLADMSAELQRLVSLDLDRQEHLGLQDYYGEAA